MKQIENNFFGATVKMEFTTKELDEISTMLDGYLCLHYQKYWDELIKNAGNPEKVKELSTTSSRKSYRIKAIRDFFATAVAICELCSTATNELD